MILKNAKIVDDSFRLRNADIAVDGDRISAIGPALSGGKEYDFTGCVIVPGFIDIHIHGCVGADTCDADAEGLAKMCEHLVREGVTSFCPTTMNQFFHSVTLDKDKCMIPLGDINSTVLLLITCNEDRNFVFHHRIHSREFTLDTRELRAVLGNEVRLNSSEVTEWIKGYLSEQTQFIKEESTDEVFSGTSGDQG